MRKAHIVRLCVFLSLMAVMAAGAVGAAGARAPDEGVTVSGRGAATARAAEVEIEAAAVGTGDTAAEAIFKHRGVLLTAREELKKLEIPSLRVEPAGFAVQEPVDPAAAMMAMQGRPADRSRVQVRERVRITLGGVADAKPEELLDQLGKVIDVAAKAGLQVGPQTGQNYIRAQVLAQTGGGSAIVTFRVPDAAAQRKEAYRLALEDARAQAQRLAELSGRRLGGVIAVRDDSALPTTDSETAAMLAWMSATARPQTPEASSETFGEVSVQAAVTVRFDLVRGEEK